MVYGEDLPDGVGYDFIGDTCYAISGSSGGTGGSGTGGNSNSSSVTYYPGTDQWQSTISAIDNFKHGNEEQPSQGEPDTVTTSFGQWLWRKVSEL